MKPGIKWTQVFFIHLYSKQNESYDAKEIIIDEFIGIYLILLFYDYVFLINNYITLILIFILFRFFDITKIFPANIVDKKIKNPLSGFMSRVFQHELDHLEGKLMVENNKIKNVYRISENENIQTLYSNLVKELSSF